METWALGVWLNGLGIVLQSERWLVQFSGKAHIWAVGLVPSWEQVRGYGRMFLSH